MTERLRLDFEGGIARVRLARATKRNALDLDMFEAVARIQRELARERRLRVVILSGEGPDFCSGLDVKSVMASRRAARRLMWKWLPWRPNLAQQAGVGWRRLAAPVIAALHGRCWGGGLQIALGADFRIAHPQTSLSIMEGKWGLIPDMGGTLALRDNLQRDQATRLAMTAEVLKATEALELGLITEISEDPERAARALAETLLQRSPDAVAAAKRLYQKSWGGDGRVLARESLYQLRILAGANRRIAARRARGEKADFRDPGRW
jgi:enoyl-CoA hydratase/carnithine racemase